MYDLAIKSLVKSFGFTAFWQQSGPVPRADDGALDFLALPRFPFGGIYGGEEDFKTKVATLPLPIESVTLLDKPKGSPLRDTLLPSDVDRPVLNLKLNTQASVQCFASGQGSIDVESDGINISARAGRALPVGRSRYNCTAASGESGRFFWYSHFFIRKRADGTWYPEP